MASITTDLWTDNYIQRHFLSVTFHYVKDIKLSNIVLGVKSMDFQKCTAENILTKLKSVLNEFDINEIDKIKFVTDRGSNIVKALENNIRINCANHLFNNVLNSAFNDTEELNPMLESCKKLVKYFKKSNLQHLLATSLKNYCITRWNSYLHLFKSISNNWLAIQDILTQNSELHRIAEINFPVLLALVELFEKFDKISKKLQGENYVTINYVYLSINSLKKICAANPSDSESIAKLKVNIFNEINKKWIPNVNTYQYAACFLFPPTNRALEEEILTQVKEFCISEILSNEEFSNPETHTQIPNENETQGDFQLFFSDFINARKPTTEESILDEFNRYSSCYVDADINFDVLDWWNHHTNDYPRLSKLAKKILAIPASSAASERVFSTAGNIITEKRNRLGPKSVNNILFLNSVFKYQ